MTDLFMPLEKNKMSLSELKKNRPIVKLSSVDKYYQSPETDTKLKVLEAIDFWVNRGDAVSITGPSGSGKTTLLNICGALDNPSSGEVEICKNTISDLSETEMDDLRKRKIGFIFQQHHLLPQLSVFENVLLPALAVKNKIDNTVVDRGKNLLKRAGLLKRINHKPGEMSGGECQRTAVIRSLINSPEIILADEPTGSLDYKTSAIITELLLELKFEENLTLIVVTHSDDLARKMETRYTLDQFRLIHEKETNL